MDLEACGGCDCCSDKSTYDCEILEKEGGKDRGGLGIYVKYIKRSGAQHEE